MDSANPGDRIDRAYSAMVRNGFSDHTGRIVKSKGVVMVASGASLRLTSASPRTKLYSMFQYEGRVGEFPNSRLIVIAGSTCYRSKANDLLSAMDVVTFDSEVDTPSFARPSAGAFRDQYFYHQNGFDVPFRLRCEEDDQTEPAVLAETLGLRPPAYAMFQATTTAGAAKRFPADTNVSYCVTFVYGTRGESGPGPVLTWKVASPTATVDELNFTTLPLGPSGCTARRIYRSYIGRGQATVTGTTKIISALEEGPNVEMFLLATIHDNTSTTFIDKFDDPSLVKTQRVPPLRPFPYRARYQALHLDRLFGANVKEHPWTLGLYYDKTRTDIAPTDYRVSVSNTGAGTLTFEKKVAGVWSNDTAVGTGGTGTVTSYTTKSLRAIMAEIMGTPVNSASDHYTQGGGAGAGICVVPQPLLDLDRSYKFKEVSQRSIYTDAYWTFGLDDETGIDGPRAYPNRIVWMDVTFPEQGNPFNAADLTRYGSKKINGVVPLDNTLAVQTDSDTYFVRGDFVPNNLSVPNFSVERSQATHGSICTRPDATATMPDLGTVCIAHDGFRVFRGESSTLGGSEVKNILERVFREPVARDQVAMVYYAGELFVALPTDEVP